MVCVREGQRVGLEASLGEGLARGAEAVLVATPVPRRLLPAHLDPLLAIQAFEI